MGRAARGGGREVEQGRLSGRAAPLHGDQPELAEGSAGDFTRGGAGHHLYLNVRPGDCELHSGLPRAVHEQGQVHAVFVLYPM